MSKRNSWPWRRARELYHWLELPGRAKRAQLADAWGPPQAAPAREAAIDAAVAWLGRAQDNSPSRDGGVARHYSVIKGWGTSYPETTGYIIPTMLAHAAWRGDPGTRARARRMLDWLVAIQFPEGGFQGGRIDSTPVVPVIFNTGQILLGLAAGVAEFGDQYREPMCRAADWLVEVQDADGCWRRHATPFAGPGEKAYETHVSWGLLEAAKLAPERPYAAAALKNVGWALGAQRSNGWFDKCCLTDPECPLTHTLGYVLRGILEAYLFSGEADLLAAARLTADGLLGARRDDGSLPGRLNADWSPAVGWVCLTGLVQISHCWLLLSRITGEKRYLRAGIAGNHYVRRTVSIDGPDATRGGVRGSFPINGDYGKFEYLNWAPKFLVDSHLLELTLTDADQENVS